MTSSVTKTCFDAIRAKQSALAAGYDPLVVENQDIYEQFLRMAVDSSSVEDRSQMEPEPKGNPRTRRQTPLVNAGYAFRVLSISYAIRAFVSYHKLVSSRLQQDQSECKNSIKRRIRIVFLGCGVDVIGLWSRSLVEIDCKIMEVSIIEIDKPEVCSIKKKMITNQGMVNNLVETYSNGDDTNNLSSKNINEVQYYAGKIVLPSPLSREKVGSFSDKCSDECHDYFLIPGDLNGMSSLESIFTLDITCNQGETPTLVVSELVLSYLPPSATDRLLRWCSGRLCQTSDSAFICLEPLGTPSETTEEIPQRRKNHGTTIAVEQGYQQDYSKKFHDKMVRGRSSSESDSRKFTQPSDCFFHPLGSSGPEITRTLRENGFCGASSATSLGVISSMAAVSAKSRRNKYEEKNLICPEVFDEHSSLIFHLQSYVLACGFISPKLRPRKQYGDLLFRRLLCPWDHRPNTGPDLASLKAGLPIIDPELGVVYAEIEASDESSVRTLFQSTYGKEYMEKHPAIRKMVKGVLNNDLKGTQYSGIAVNYDEDECISSSSAIGDFYRSMGGIFVVASKYTMQSTVEEKMEKEKNDDLIQSSKRQIVGCIGIRSYEGKGADSKKILEIFRLAVANKHRRRGIGKSLLRVVEMYAQERCKEQGHANLKFVANTLTVLEEATSLYKKCGYRVEKETPLGPRLVLRTYAKEVCRDN